MNTPWKFQHSYATLPSRFYSALNPVPVKKPRLTAFNEPLADELGLGRGPLADDELARIFSGNELTEGMHPLAQAYAGHQFGHFVILGDGRALLLGEVLDRQGCRFDVQLKGSGQTPFSRRGDGRAALGPMLREYLVSNAMVALGIPTTRSLAVVATGEMVYRPHPLPGAILTRVAQSHVRVGTFEVLLAHEDVEGLQLLADYVIQRHYPWTRETKDPLLALFAEVTRRQAELVARWMEVGFIHGVMNTDNVSIAGETIDYGPCAFLDEYHPDTVFSSIDQHGRYRYGNQPGIAQWNLARFAETLLPLMTSRGTSLTQAQSSLQEILSEFWVHFEAAWLSGMGAKLGLGIATDEDQRTTRALVDRWLDLMARNRADFTNSHRGLYDYAVALATGEQDPVSRIRTQDQEFFRREETARFLTDWSRTLHDQGRETQAAAEMGTRNPAVIPRNHRVEAALQQAESTGDLSLFQELQRVLADPYSVTLPEYQNPPQEHERVRETFCGT